MARPDLRIQAVQLLRYVEPQTGWFTLERIVWGLFRQGSAGSSSLAHAGRRPAALTARRLRKYYALGA
jgi:hypothetical protein